MCENVTIPKRDCSGVPPQFHMVLKNWSCFNFFFPVELLQLLVQIRVVTPAFVTNTWSWFRRTQKHGLVIYLHPTTTDK
jgi:hypothetical protein